MRTTMPRKQERMAVSVSSLIAAPVDAERAGTAPPLGGRSRPRTGLAIQVGANIRRWRRERGMSQTKLAAAVGRARTALCRWESGDRLPSLATLARVAWVLECTLGDLIAGVVAIKPDPLIDASGEE
jgi:DNA-binding XRE family transcriptional regulator